ncbi:PAS domain S-box protein [Desulfobacter sp.]|uniref:PAS domain-containing protein n=1 Tax=Desulfobacter sp. TaxID=2294 RepID=UPI003D0BD804
MLVRDNLEGLQAVSFGRIDAMVTDLATASHTIDHHGITNLKICRFLPGGELTYVNEAYSKYLGKTAETLFGSSFLSLIPKEAHEQVKHALSTLTAESPAQSNEHKALALDGEIRWQRWTNRALFDAGGKVVAFQSIGEDITDHVRADIIGYTLDEISPVSIDTWIKFCHPEDLKESNRLLLIIHAGAICEPSSSPLFGLALVEDITERNKAVGKMTIETGNTTFDEAYCAVHAGFIPGEFAMLA